MATLVSTALMGFFVWAPLAAGPLASASEQAPALVQPTYSVAMTGYNAVPGQTDDNPEITASGAYSDPDIVAARSRDLADQLPFGTVIEIVAASSTPGCGYSAVSDDIGLRVIADTMNARMHNKIDILFGGYRTARTFGVCDNVEIRVVGTVDINHMPKSQDDLRLAVGYLPKANQEKLAVSK